MAEIKHSDDEVQAHRAAIEIYLADLTKRLGADRVLGLAGTGHQHNAIIRVGELQAMPITVEVRFGHVIAAADIVELIEAATNNPGGVGEA